MSDNPVVPTTRTSERKRASSKRSANQEADKPRHSAKAYAVWLLSRREYSAAMLEKKLLLRGYAAEETQEAMRFVLEHNYQSDERYAGMKARGTAHRAGDWKISMMLMQKGIDEQTAKEQIAELLPEEERAAQVAKAKFAVQVGFGGITPELSQKIWRYVAYRGFGSKAIKHALHCLKQET
jgi:regulatory protein